MKNKERYIFILLETVNSIIGFGILFGFIIPLIVFFPFLLIFLYLSPGYFFIFFIPLIFLTIGSTYCLNDKIPTENLARLILIYTMIFILYLISFSMVTIALFDRTYPIFFILMSLVYYGYFYLIIPLIGVIIITILYLKVNRSNMNTVIHYYSFSV